MHVIQHHIVDYVKMTGKTLGETNDQVIETCHQEVQNRMIASKYQVRNNARNAYGTQLFRGIMLYNCNNL